MWIGLTTSNPTHLARKHTKDYLPKPRDLKQSWCLKTDSGMRYYRGMSDRPSQQVGLCDAWLEEVGNRTPTKGDVLSISLTEYHSITVAYNGIAVTDVFHDLPTEDMWVAVGLHDRQVSAVCSGKPISDRYCISMIIILSYNCLVLFLMLINFILFINTIFFFCLL